MNVELDQVVALEVTDEALEGASGGVAITYTTASVCDICK